MPGDLKVGIRLTADGKGFVGEVRVAKRELDKLGIGTRKAGRATAEYTRTARRATAANRSFGKSFLEAHGHTLKYLGSIGGVTLAARGLLRHADSYTQISNAVRIATGSAAEHAQVSDELFGIAQRTRAPLTAVADLYQKLSISAADLGASNADMLSVIEGVGQALVINGTNATQASGALLQLSQALGGGIVRAEEMNSVLENAKPILIAAANHLDRAGGSVSKLRELVAAGEVTSREFFAALQRGLPELAADFEQANSTIGQGFVQVDNAITHFIGRTDEANGASAAFAGTLESMAEAIASVDTDALAKSLVAVQPFAEALVYIGGRMTLALAAYTLTAGGAAKATLTLAGRMTAFNTAVAIAATRAGRATLAFKATRRAAFGLGRVLAVAAGPVGWITLAAGAVATLAFNTREASGAADEYARIQEQIKAGQSDAPGGEKSNTKLLEYAQNAADEAEAQLALVRAAQANNVHDEVVQEILAPFIRRLDVAKNVLAEVQARVEREASLQLNDIPPDSAVPKPAASPGADAADTAFANLQRQNQTARERIEADYRQSLAIIAAADKAGDEEITEAKKRALQARNRGLHQIYTRFIGERARADAAALEQEKERKRQAAQALIDSGVPALQAFQARQKELAGVTDLSAVALENQAAKTRITREVAEEYEKATGEVRAAIVASRLAIEQQEAALQRQSAAYQTITGNAAAYARQLRDLNAAEALALQNAANSGAPPGAVAAQQEDIAANAARERQRIHTERHLEGVRWRWEEEIRLAQGYRDAIEQAEDQHQKNLLGLKLQGQPAIAALAQKHSKTIVALDKNEEVSAKRKFKLGLDLAQEGLSQAAAHSKEAFKLNQIAGIAQASINTYESITKALAAFPPPYSYIAAAAAGAAGFAQVAAIRAQQPPQGFALGGVVDSPAFFSARGVPSGVAGEAGPEAILPLRRGRGGRLGVDAGGMRPVVIRITLGDVHVQAAPGERADAAAGRAVQERVVATLEPAVRKIIVNEQRPGGLLNKTTIAA